MSKEFLLTVSRLCFALGWCVLLLYVGTEFLGVKTVALWRFFAGWFALVFAWVALMVGFKVIWDD